MRTALLVFRLAGVAPGQPFSFGVRGGVRLNDDRTGFSSSESKPYVIGAAVAVKLPRGLGLEFDALYRRVGYRTSEQDIVGDLINTRAPGNSWEFPILVRHSVWRRLYAAAGYAPRIINGTVHSEGSYVTSLFPFTREFRQSNYPGSWETTHGLVLAGGMEKPLGLLHLSPEIRYTRWNQPSVEVGGYHLLLVEGALNQLDLMVGITIP
jgi:hypothetical protein